VAEILVGRRLERIRLLLVRRSLQSFALSWRDPAGDPLDLTGKTATIELDATPPVVWTATNNTAVTTWSLTHSQSDLPARTYLGKVVMSDADGPIVAYGLTVEVQ